MAGPTEEGRGTQVSAESSHHTAAFGTRTVTAHAGASMRVNTWVRYLG